MNVVVAYDVSDDNVRSRISAMLCHYGIRLQRSVFECLIDEESLREFIDRVDGMIDHEQDVVQVFPSCDPCRGTRVHLGQARREFEAIYWVV